MHLYEALGRRVVRWREARYPHADHPTIAEILSWAALPEGEGFRLRPPQLRALETYWYLRLVEGMPHVFDLYQRLFPPKEALVRDLLASRLAAFSDNRLTDLGQLATNEARDVSWILAEHAHNNPRKLLRLCEWVLIHLEESSTGWREGAAR